MSIKLCDFAYSLRRPGPGVWSWEDNVGLIPQTHKALLMTMMNLHVMLKESYVSELELLVSLTKLILNRYFDEIK